MQKHRKMSIPKVNGHVQVVARAGSGKTTTLVNRTLFLLKHCRVAPDQMLWLAFNRKAVLEIRRRLLGLLNEGAEIAVAEEIPRLRREAVKNNRSVKEDVESSAVASVAAKLNVVLPHIILDSLVGRARVGCWLRDRVGRATLQAHACEEEQHPRAGCQWLNRVRSALAQKVNRVEAGKVNGHMDLVKKPSGQLRNLGS